MSIQKARRGSYMKRTQGGTKSNRRSAPSKSFKEKKKAEYKQKKAEENLNTYIKNNQNLKNQSTYVGDGGKNDRSVLSTVSDAPQKFGKNKESRKAFVERNLRADGTPNSAAQAMLDFYNDGRNDYQRGLNALRTSSPEAEQAYAKRFPISNFAMKMGPVIAGAATGIPFGVMDLFNKGRNKFTNLSDRDDILGAIARTTNDIASSFTPEQAKNIDTNIETKKPIDQVLRDENIVSTRADVDPILSNSTAQTGAEGIVDIFDNDAEKAAMDASLPTGNIVYNPYNSNPYSPGSREYNEFEQFKQFKESQEQSDDDFEGVEDGVFQRAGEFKLEADEPSVNLSGVTDYEEEFEDTFGVPMKGNIEVPSLTRPGEIERGLGDRLTRETFALDNNIPLDQIGEVYPKTTSYPLRGNIMKDGDITAGYYNPTGDFNYGDYGIDDDVIFSDRISEMQKLGQEIRTAPGMKDGGLTDNYGNMSTHEKLMRMAAEMYG